MKKLYLHPDSNNWLKFKKCETIKETNTSWIFDDILRN